MRNKKKKKKKKNNKDNLRHFWYTFKWKNMCFIGVPEGQDKYKEAESLFKEKQWLKISLTQRKKETSNPGSSEFQIRTLEEKL